jgi:acetyl-CoA carboxylase biotin carboxyl carrier protein
MTLTAKDVAEIMRLLEESSFDSLSLEINGIKLKLQRGSAARVPPDSVDASSLAAAPPVTHPGTSKAKPPPKPGLLDVPSPLLGVFYRAPKPGEPAFVQIGTKVSADAVVGIVEVMKLMNSVRAGVAGEVVEILAENGALVEYGEVLLRVRPEVRE